MAELRPQVMWGLIALCWAAAAVIINPAGDFPLNDDWAYGRVVQSLHELGRLQFPGEVAVSLVAQSTWGLLFVELFGFSFSVLRVSTLVAGFAGVIFSFELFRVLDLSPVAKRLGAACVGFTPLYLCLSYTFMTDVFFFTASVGSLLFYVQFLKARREHHFWTATAFSLLAVFTRDAGLVLPAALWVGSLLRGRNGIGATSWRAWLPLLVCGSALLIYQQWLVATDRLPVAYGIHAQRLDDIGVSDYLQTAVSSARAIFCYLGLLLFPVLLPIAMAKLAGGSGRERLRALAIGGAVAGVLVVWSLVERSVLPLFVGNIFSPASLGPVVLPSAARFLGLTSRAFWVPVTLLAIAGAALLAMLLADVIRSIRRRSDQSHLTVAIVAAIYAGALLVTVALDRYFLLLLPLTIVLVGSIKAEPPRWTLAVAVCILATMAGFGIAGTHDYLAWNRARWVLARDLLTREPPDRLDGGLEIDAWHAYPLDRPFVSDRSWWWVATKPYVITLGELPGFRLIARTQTHTWLPFGDGYIYLLQRE